MCGFLGVVLLQLRRPPGRAAVLGHHIVAAAAIPLRVAAELKGPRSQTLFEAAGKSQKKEAKVYRQLQSEQARTSCISSPTHCNSMRNYMKQRCAHVLRMRKMQAGLCQT